MMDDLQIRDLPIPVRPAKLDEEGNRLLTAGREEFNLEKYGTRPTRLTAAALLQTAERDLVVRAQNDLIRQARALPAAKRHQSIWSDEPLRKHGFLAEHVIGSTPAEVLECALAARDRTLSNTDNANTLRLYRDADTLAAAIVLARETPPS